MTQELPTLLELLIAGATLIAHMLVIVAFVGVSCFVCIAFWRGLMSLASWLCDKIL